MHHSNLLEGYVTTLYSSWESSWRVDELVGPPDHLWASIGSGLVDFLHRQLPVSVADPVTVGQGSGVEQSGYKLFLSKTPSVRNLRHFSRLFPSALLILVVRDGRSVVESRVKSFDWNYEVAMKDWARAATEIDDFRRWAEVRGQKFMIVSYEELYGDLHSTLRSVFSFLNLSPASYDFSAAEHMGITGSSELKQSAGGKVHWQKIEKSAEFNPLARFGNWPVSRQRRFHWIAGKQQVLLGYESEAPQRTGFFCRLYNHVLDATFYLRVFPWYVRKGMPRILGWLKRRIAS